MKTKYLSSLFFIIGLTLSSVSCASTSQDNRTLYERLGGYDAVVAVVNDLVPRLAKDKKLGRFWAHRGDDGIDREVQLVIDFIANKAGGKLYYTGREIKESHVGMRISEDDWKIFMKHLDATLDKFKLPPRERKDVIDFMESTKKDMVELP
ncbi:MAG: group 1 truncated hemoglobin [Gammaproteobacteria bacterium]|nr:group 1 truncated hemoglobin [Gammaproteobacteria bacterium]